MKKKLLNSSRALTLDNVRKGNEEKEENMQELIERKLVSITYMETHKELVISI